MTSIEMIRDYGKLWWQDFKATRQDCDKTRQKGTAPNTQPKQETP
jgi:hypothetical protein